MILARTALTPFEAFLPPDASNAGAPSKRCGPGACDLDFDGLLTFDESLSGWSHLVAFALQQVRDILVGLIHRRFDRGLALQGFRNP